MNLHLTNTLTGNIEEFIPIEKGKVKLYVCGPTVYDSPHIGNGRSAVVYDVLFRVLKFIYGSENVTFVRNITDVDDKINQRAKDLNISIRQLTEKTTKIFHEDMEYLNCQSPNFEPRATENIDVMLNIINKLIEKNHAYVANNHVYFSVESFPEYTNLSKRKFQDLISGARIEIDEHKRNPADFVLWKPADKEDHESSLFASKWGLGKPGWHIECSAMSYKYLGENFDIHGGGADLIFPHHTNEIAQSRCAFSDSKYANYWVHNGFLTVNGEKMSKSLDNFIIINDLKYSKIEGEVARFMMINKHYRSPLDFNSKSLEDSKKYLDYCYRALEKSQITEISEKDIKKYINRDFLNAILYDLNTHQAFSIIHDIAKKIQKTDDKDSLKFLGRMLISCGKLLGFFSKTPSEWFNSAKNSQEEILELLEMRKSAKEDRNFTLADQLREKLLSLGISVEDKKDGSYTWRKL